MHWAIVSLLIMGKVTNGSCDYIIIYKSIERDAVRPKSKHIENFATKKPKN